MKEIKFRVWDSWHNLMHYSNHSKVEVEKDCQTFYPWGFMMDKDIGVHAGFLTFMQYTGLKDKNGKEIYEGDVIKETFPRDKSDPAYNSYGNEGIVEWHEKIGAWCWEHGEEWGMIDTQDVGIVGNIYENPDLAK